MGKLGNVRGHAWITDVAVREAGVLWTPAGRRVAAGAEARQPAEGLAALEADFGKIIAHGWRPFPSRVHFFRLENTGIVQTGTKTASGTIASVSIGSAYKFKSRGFEWVGF